MTALIVIACIIAFIIALGFISIKLDVVFGSEADFSVFLKVLFFKFNISSKKTKKVKKKKKGKGKKKKLKEENEEPPKEQEEQDLKKEKKEFSEILELVKMFLEPLPRFLKKLCEKIHIKDLNVVWMIATDDAAKTAINYGKYCGVFYGVLGILSNIFNVHIKKIRLYPDFIKEEPYYFVSFRLQTRIGVIIIAAISYLWAVVKKYIKS